VTILLIGLGGFAGAITRYLVDAGATNLLGAAFPWGILLVNLSGSFALGLLFAVGAERDMIPASVRTTVFVGFLGAYTTFSTLTLDTVRLVERGDWGAAFGNAVGSMALGMLAVVAGLAIGRQWAAS
jgi:fluoride exporter